MDVEVVTPKDHISILRVKGRIDASTSGRLESSVLSALEGTGRACILNMAGVEYISSAGLRVLVIGAKKANSTGGAFTICAVQPPVARILEMVGFEPLFQAYEDEDSAVKASEKICVA
jgi:anti-anti-sigma factor